MEYNGVHKQAVVFQIYCAYYTTVSQYYEKPIVNTKDCELIGPTAQQSDFVTFATTFMHQENIVLSKDLSNATL